MAGILEDTGRRERVWFVCGHAPEVNVMRRRRGEPETRKPNQYQSHCQSG